MSDKSLISIIVPVYNASEYISKCLDSLLFQTHSNIEVLCVDDCSTDNSIEIIEQFVQKDSRIKLIKLQQNGGPAVARNTGLEYATGNYIMFCDNDDEYTPKMCETLLSTMIDSDADLVTCKSEIENKHIDLGLANYINSNPLGKFHLVPRYKASINVLLWNKIYKKSLIDKYSIKFPNGISSEDDAFIMKYVSVTNKYCGLNQKLHKHLFRMTSFTNTLGKENLGKRKFDKISIIRDFYDFLILNNLFDEQEVYFKQRVIAELKYLMIYNTKLADRKKTIELYNEFVRSAEMLDYELYSYDKLFKKFEKGKLLLSLPSRLCKYYWF